MIIAVIGLPGSGKSEVRKCLMEKMEFSRVYFGDVVFDQMKKRGLEKNEKNERFVREELRAKHGMAVMAVRSIPKIQKELKKGKNVLIESLYSWEEYLIIKDNFLETIFIAVYSPPEMRYRRLSKRKERPLTREEAESRDHAQITNLHQAGPIAMADYTIINDGNLGDLHTKIEGAMEEINAQENKGV